MTNYRRIYTPGATWFFTVNLAERNNNALLIENIDQLRQAFRYVKQRRPFEINAVVVLPEHLHCIWTLPPSDSDYSTRWNLLKAHFSRSIDKGEHVSASRMSKREQGIWQRRLGAFNNRRARFQPTYRLYPLESGNTRLGKTGG